MDNFLGEIGGLEGLLNMDSCLGEFGGIHKGLSL